MTKEKLLLLDGNSLAYRAFFALPLLTNDQGIHTNAIYGFTPRSSVRIWSMVLPGGVHQRTSSPILIRCLKTTSSSPKRSG